MKKVHISKLVFFVFMLIAVFYLHAQNKALGKKQGSTKPTTSTSSAVNPTTWYLDADGDGYCIDVVVSVNAPGSQWKNTAVALGDCNDNDPLVHEPQLWYLDADNDGYYINQQISCTSPGVGWRTSGSSFGDCNDADPSIHDPQSWYFDGDNDGYCTAFKTACSNPGKGWKMSSGITGYVNTASFGDCDDNDANVYKMQTWYHDADKDGWYVSTQLNCKKPGPNWYLPGEFLNSGAYYGDCDDADNTEQENWWYLDKDGDGYFTDFRKSCGSPVPEGDWKKTAYQFGDCNDNDPFNWSPYCGSCDGQGAPLYLWALDADNDRYATALIWACTSPGTGWVQTTLYSQHFLGYADCNDHDPNVIAPTTWYLDADGDGYYIDTKVSCSSPGVGWTIYARAGFGDCDDNDSNVHESGIWYLDADNDNHYEIKQIACSSPGVGWKQSVENWFIFYGDCDDNDPNVYERTWYKDADGDGYFTASQKTCISPGTGWVLTANTFGDCNDNDPNVYRSLTLYQDADGDGYHNSIVTMCVGTNIPNGYNQYTYGKDQDDNDITINTQNADFNVTNLEGCKQVVYKGKTYTNNAVLKDTVKYWGSSYDSLYNIIYITITNTLAKTNSIAINGCKSVVFNGKTYTNSTILRDTLKTTNGCDSVFNITNIIVSKIVATSSTISIKGCNKVVYNNIEYTSPVLVKDTLKNMYGCDSVFINATITVVPLTPTDTIIHLYGCNDFTYKGITYTYSTIVQDTVRNMLGCDSVYENRYLHLRNLPIAYKTTNVTGCNSVVYKSKTYTSSAILQDTVRYVSSGCDSMYNTVNIIVTKITPISINVKVNGCDSAVYRGITYKNTTTKLDTLKTVYGCDSLYVTAEINIYSSFPPTVIIEVISPYTGIVVPGTTAVFSATCSTKIDHYAWYKNGQLVGSDSSIYIDKFLKTNDSVWCKTTSSFCSTNVVKSNVLSFYVSAAISTMIVGKMGYGFSGDGGLASLAQIRKPTGLVFDKLGNLFFLDSYNNRIRKINTAGIITTVAGNGSTTNSGDGGAATAAGLSNPYWLAVDSLGNLYVSSGSNVVRKISTSGIITTVAGTGVAGYSGDGGVATSAKIAGPQGLALDAAGNLYIAESGNSIIRKVSTTGIISTFVSSVSQPTSLTFDAAGNLYACLTGNDQIIKINNIGKIDTVFSNTNSTLYGGYGVPAYNFRAVSPNCLAFDKQGIMYFSTGGYSDSLSKIYHYIFKVDAKTQKVYAVAGTTLSGFSGDSSAASTMPVTATAGMSFDNAGNLIFSSYFSVIRKINFVTETVVKSFNPTTAYIGATINIIGKNFTGASAVAFGDTTATSFTVINDSTITAVVGSGSAGSVSVTSHGSIGSLAGFNFCKPAVSKSVAISGCNTVIYKGKVYSNNASFIDTVYSIGNCDSVFNSVKITVTKITATSNNSNLSGCNSVVYKGKTYSASTVVKDTVKSVQGCDSVYNIANLTVTKITATTNNSNLSGCNSVVYKGKTYTASTVVKDTVKSVGGCDSVYNVANLTVTKITATSNNSNLSGCNSVAYNGKNYNSSTIVRDTIRSIKGCDSIYNVGNITIFNTGISGKIVHPSKGAVINNVNTYLSGTVKDSSINNNFYTYSCMPLAGNYTVRLTKNNDKNKANGVSTIDAALVQSHILQKALLKNPYKIIAADVNGDNKVSALDIVFMKRLILVLDTTFTGKRLWAFIDSSYNFTDTTNPFPHKDSISFTGLSASKTNQTFIGMKLGDVNWDWNPAVAKPYNNTVNTVELGYPSEGSNPADRYLRIPIKVKNFKEMMGMQFTLGFNADVLRFKGIENNLLNIEIGDNHIAEGKLSMLWLDAKNEVKTLADGTEIMTLLFERKELSIIHNNSLTIDGSITSIEAFDKDYQLHSIVLKPFIISSNISKETWTIAPNPTTNGLIQIQMSLKDNKTIVFNLLDNTGRLLLTKKLEGIKGTNSFTLHQQKHLSEGLYYLQAIGIEGEEVKKVIIK